MLVLWLDSLSQFWMNMTLLYSYTEVGKLFVIEGRMGLQRVCRGPDRYKSHKLTHSQYSHRQPNVYSRKVCILVVTVWLTLAYKFITMNDCYVTWSWVSGDPLATWCCLMSHAAVGAVAAGCLYQIAVLCSLSHGHWLCVYEMPGHGPLHRWQRGPVIMLQLTGRRGPDRRSLRAGFGPQAGLCRPLIYTLNISSFTRYSAATDLRWGENFNKFLFCNSLLYIAVKNTKIGQYLSELSKNKCLVFYGPQCSLLQCESKNPPWGT